MSEFSRLPPGQIELQEFPRFGLIQFAERLPRENADLRIRVDGDVERSVVFAKELAALYRVEQVSDFHCVTTWTHRGVCWSGVRFSDFYQQLVIPQAKPSADATHVIFRGRDGYAVSLPLQDLLDESVLLADQMNGQPLSNAHGAPVRLIAPAHYGYKNPKHVSRIEFWTDDRNYNPAAFRFMDHPRARVALEERGRFFPGWLLRYLYRPLIGPTIRRFRSTMTSEDR